MSKTLQRKTVRNKTPRERGERWLTFLDVPLPQRLRVIRELRGYSMKHVATGIGISQPTYYLVEAGTTALSLSRLAQLAAFYGEPLSLFTTGYAVTDEERRTVAAGNALAAPTGA